MPRPHELCHCGELPHPSGVVGCKDEPRELAGAGLADRLLGAYERVERQIMITDTEVYDRVKIDRSPRDSAFTHRITISPDGAGKPRTLRLNRDELIALAELATEYVDQIL